MEVLRTFLVSIATDAQGPQREKSKVIFAKDIQEAEAKADGQLVRIKKMDWIPVRSESAVETPGSRYVLAEYKKTLLDKDESPVIFVIRTTDFGTIDDRIRVTHEKFLQKSHVLQGVETLDLEVQE